MFAVVKQRMQMCCSPHRKALTCARTIYRNEGIAAFYRAYPTMLTMSLPFQIVNFVVYEKMKKITTLVALMIQIMRVLDI